MQVCACLQEGVFVYARVRVSECASVCFRICEVACMRVCICVYAMVSVCEFVCMWGSVSYRNVF